MVRGDDFQVKDIVFPVKLFTKFADYHRRATSQEVTGHFAIISYLNYRKSEIIFLLLTVRNYLRRARGQIV